MKKLVIQQFLFYGSETWKSKLKTIQIPKQKKV